MLIKPPLEELLPKVESRYTLAMLVAKRARQLVDGAQPMVQDEGKNLVTVACEEVMADKVVGVPGESRPTVPLRPEIEEARRIAREQAEAQAVIDAFPEVGQIKAIEQKTEVETTVIDVFNLSATDDDAEGHLDASENDITGDSEDVVSENGETVQDDTQEEVQSSDVPETSEDSDEELDDVSTQDVKDLKALDGVQEEEKSE